MKLYVYHFNTTSKEVEAREVEVQEKPKTYNVVGGTLPFYPVSRVLKEEVDNIKTIGTKNFVYFSSKDDPKTAVRAFRKYWSENVENTKARLEEFEDYYHSCFKFSMPEGVLRIP